MRPTSRPQSALRAPLNRVLGTEANVRLLRVLAGTSQPIAPSLLARRAELNLSGALKALDGLEELGFVERIGSGARRPVAFVREHPLSAAITALFIAEDRRFESILARLRAAGERVSPRPTSIWVEGPAAAGHDGVADPLIVGMLCRAHDVARSLESFEDSIARIQRDLDVTIEVRARTIADLKGSKPGELSELRVAIPVLGAPPTAVLDGDEVGRDRQLAGPDRLTHGELDARARETARRVAGLIRTDPGIVDRTRAFLGRAIESPEHGSDRTTREWERVLRTMSTARLRRFLVDPGERATRLRQSLPFLSVLSDEQRDVVASPREAKRLRRK